MAIDNSGLSGFNANKPILTSPDKLLSKIQSQDSTAPVVDVNYVDAKTAGSTTPAKSDNFSASASLISSAMAGGIGTKFNAKDINTIGESMRAPQVQNAMSEVQTRHYTGGSSTGYNDYNNYNNNSNNYNNNSYNNGYNDYGGVESVRGNRYGNNQYNNGNGRGNYGGVETFGSNTSPEMMMAYKDIARGGLEGAKYGAIIGGGVSALVNGWNVMTGKTKSPDAVGAVAADTVTAGISGSVGAVAGGFASLGLGIGGVAGPVGLAVSIGVGALGAVASQVLLQKTGLYDAIKSKVAGMLGGK